MSFHLFDALLPLACLLHCCPCSPRHEWQYVFAAETKTKDPNLMTIFIKSFRSVSKLFLLLFESECTWTSFIYHRTKKLNLLSLILGKHLKKLKFREAGRWPVTSTSAEETGLPSATNRPLVDLERRSL